MKFNTNMLFFFSKQARWLCQKTLSLWDPEEITQKTVVSRPCPEKRKDQAQISGYFL